VNHPSIFQVGRVDDDGTTVTVHGWGLGLCASGCCCHRDPTGGFLSIAEQQGAGTLGLVSYDEDCTCCQPWTAAELADIVRDLADIDGMSVA
jgi:hypothetical protein